MSLTPAYGSDTAGGGTGGSVSRDMFFADIIARDLFTSANPSRITQGVTCAVENGPNSYVYYQYDEAGSDWRTADQIFQGPQGTSGADGLDGDSAYQVAVNNGFSGSEAAWLLSLNGTDGTDGTNGVDGASAYQIAVTNGFVGTPEQWVASLHGTDGVDGVDGDNGYDIAVANGFVGSQVEWLESLHGDNGYDIAVNNGFVGTEAEWLASLHGTDGDSGYQVALNNGFVGTEAEWLLTLKGDNGASGDSGYQVALDNGFVGTETEWLESLKGDDGADGADGKSAYQSAFEGGYTGSEADFNTRMLAVPLTATQTAREIEALPYDDKLDAVNGIKNLSSAVRDNIGRNRGNISYIAGMSQFDNTRTDDRWYAAESGTIGGVTFNVGDELVALDDIAAAVNLTDPEWQVKSTPISIASDTVIGGVKLDLDDFDIDGDGVLSLDESVLTDGALAQYHVDADAINRPLASSVLLATLDGDALKKSVVGADKVDIITNTTASYTTEEKTKLSNLDSKWQGSFADEAALVAALPTPSTGWGAIVRSTGTVWAESGGSWIDTQAGSFGDMLASTYDPASVGANVYDRANHTGQQAKSTVTGLEADLTQIGTDRAADVARITTLETELDAAETDIATANTGIADNLASIGTLNTSFAAMNTRVTDSESAISALETADEGQDTKIAALETSSDDYGTRIQAVEVKSNANETAVATKQDIIDTDNKLSASLVGNGDVSDAELSRLGGVTVNVQDEFNSIRANEWKLIALVEFLDPQTFAAVDILTMPEVHTAITIEKPTADVGYEVRVRKTSTTDTFIHGEVTHRVNDRGSASQQPDSQVTRTYTTRNMFSSADFNTLVTNMRDYNSVDIVLTINLEWANADGSVPNDGFMCHLRISRVFGGRANYTDRHAIYAKVERVVTDNTHLHIQGT